nr:hypothetical protein [Deltaproteobacteria bacterium]
MATRTATSSLVITQPPLADRLADGLFEQHRVGRHLDAVGLPGLSLLRGVPPRPTALVLIRDPLPVAAANRVELATHPEGAALQGEALHAVALLASDLLVQRPAREHRRIGDAQLLDLLQVEQPLAIHEGVQRPHPHRGLRRAGGFQSIIHGDPPIARTRVSAHRLQMGITARTLAGGARYGGCGVQVHAPGGGSAVGEGSGANIAAVVRLLSLRSIPTVNRHDPGRGAVIGRDALIPPDLGQLGQTIDAVDEQVVVSCEGKAVAGDIEASRDPVVHPLKQRRVFGLRRHDEVEPDQHLPANRSDVVLAAPRPLLEFLGRAPTGYPWSCW